MLSKFRKASGTVTDIDDLSLQLNDMPTFPPPRACIPWLPLDVQIAVEAGTLLCLATNLGLVLDEDCAAFLHAFLTSILDRCAHSH